MERSAEEWGARLLAALVPAVLLLIALLPVADLVATTLRSRGAGLERPERVQALVVLGSRLDGGEMTPLLAQRVARTTALYREALRAGGHPWVVASGGATGAPLASDVPTTAPTEAAVVATALAASGVPAGALLREDRARSTAENLADSSALLAAQGSALHRVVVITSDTHVARTRTLLHRPGVGGAFGGAQVQVVGTPSPTGELAEGLQREGRMALGSQAGTLAVSAASGLAVALAGRRRRPARGLPALATGSAVPAL